RLPRRFTTASGRAPRPKYRACGGATRSQTSVSSRSSTSLASLITRAPSGSATRTKAPLFETLINRYFVAYSNPSEVSLILRLTGGRFVARRWGSGRLQLREKRKELSLSHSIRADPSLSSRVIRLPSRDERVTV